MFKICFFFRKNVESKILNIETT